MALLLFSASPASALGGAIFTTDSTGTTVNGNIYAAKTDVYLDGGPQPNAPCTAAGLPNGEYYFQVTDPSGSTLLSTDAITARNFSVSGGVITGLGSTGTHAPGTGKCPGSISVQLSPFSDTPNPGHEYKVWITPVGSYSPGVGTFGFLNSDSKTDNFKVRECTSDCGGGPPNIRLTGLKFYDRNTNGINDGAINGEPGIAGWEIVKNPPTIGDVACTDAGGAYSFSVPPNSGTYTISEVAPPPGFVPAPGATWVNTTPTSADVTVGGVDLPGPDFGNVCLGAGGGLTLGFWSNKNGQALITASDLSALSALNLRTADGSSFDPTSASMLRTWLLNATATNMSYMLSAQLAAMYLNVAHGFVNGSALVYAGANPPGCSVPVNQAGFISVNALLADANTELGLDGNAIATGTAQQLQDRICQEFKKNALDAANNNGNFVQPTPCAFTAYCTPTP